MPVVKTETRRYNGQEWKMVVRVKADGAFYIALPPGVAKTLGVPLSVSAPTLKEAVKACEELLRKHTAMRTSTRKVIIYRFECNARIGKLPKDRDEDDDEGRYADGDRDDDWQVDFEQDDINFASGTVIALAVGVYEETKVEAGDNTRYNYKRAASDLPAGLRLGLGRIEQSMRGSQPSCMMAWTAEREAFFCGVGKAMDDLVLRLNKVFSENDKLIELVDSGQLLFPRSDDG